MTGYKCRSSLAAAVLLAADLETSVALQEPRPRQQAFRENASAGTAQE
jgi:hypothetical protein